SARSRPHRGPLASDGLKLLQSTSEIYLRTYCTFSAGGCTIEIPRRALHTSTSSAPTQQNGEIVLSQEENETLTQVGPGTLMGNLLRRYWTPACLSSELESD